MKVYLFTLILITLIFSSSSCSNQVEFETNKGTTTVENLIDSTLYRNGYTIFKADCNACHVTKQRLHNHLEGVVDRVGEDYLKLYLTKQDSLILAKDSNALKLKELWSNLANSHNFKYTQEQLNAIIEYLK
ncbi:MAG: c-type cytochrome [Bacteroidia bacterium]